jgi:hypothetical protein
MPATKGWGFSMKRGIQWPFCLAGGSFLVLICSENKIRLAGGWWLLCSERKVVVDKRDE